MKVACEHCPRNCILEEQQRGYCFVRQNIRGKIVCTAYGRCSCVNIDPIEKKPLAHFYPGSRVLSLGTIGCNQGCLFCQNGSISHAVSENTLVYEASPEKVAQMAVRETCRCVAYTYNEPIVWAEYVCDIARECRCRNILNVAVTSGYISAGQRPRFFENMDAVNIDLKGFSETFYEKYCHSHLGPVLETIEWCVRETDIWLELTNLLIPRANDQLDTIRRMCDWIVNQLGEDVPLHFSAFHPAHKLVDRPPTSLESLKSAYNIAKRAGLHHVYLGNVYAPAYEATWCHQCGQMVIGRDRYRITHRALKNGRCQACGTILAGKF